MRLPDRPYSQAASRLFQVARPIAAEAMNAATPERIEELFAEVDELRDAMPTPADYEPDYAREVRLAIQAVASLLGGAMVTRPGNTDDTELMAVKARLLDEALIAARERLDRYYRSEKLPQAVGEAPPPGHLEG